MTPSKFFVAMAFLTALTLTGCASIKNPLCLFACHADEKIVSSTGGK